MKRPVAPLVVAALLGAPSARALESASVDDEIEQEALGQHGNLRTRADDVSFDPRARTLELSGDVRVDAAPFHLRSDRIKLTRTRLGIEVDGKGALAFCPCLGTPLTVDFERAIVAPPGDLVLKGPTLRVYGVPVMHLPYFWLRSDEKVGLLAPDIAYRGQDGLFLGEGVHLPFRTAEGKNALDLRAGGYMLRGFAAEARLRTPTSETKLRYDRLPGAPAPALRGTPEGADDGLLVDARGATADGVLAVAWDADALRGRRGVASTTELEAAARPWDRASFGASLGAGKLVASSGVRAISRRGGGPTDFDAFGPMAAVRVSDAASASVTYDAVVEGGALRVSGTGLPQTESVSFARAEVGGLAATTLGPLAASVSVRVAGDVASGRARGGTDRAGSARARVGVPLGRAFGGSDARGELARDPWLHVLEPFAEAAVLHARGDAILGVLPGRGSSVLDGTAPITDAGLATSLGRWGRREALELVVAAGAAYGSSEAASGVRPIARGRAASTLGLLGLSVDAAWVGAERRSGVASTVRARLGPTDGPRLIANVATRSGVDPIVARAVSDAPLEPSSGFFAREGTTGGATIVVPWSRVVTTSLGGDGDADALELVGARGTLEFRDRCGCVALRAGGSHRLGRSGVDAWVALDFTTDR